MKPPLGARYPLIARMPDGVEVADGSRQTAQMNSHPPGMSVLREVRGSLRSKTTGIGVALPHDGRNLIMGIYIAGLDRIVTKLQFTWELSRCGLITKVSFPREPDGYLSGYGMIEYENPDMAVEAIFGLQGWIAGN
jgi:hypothetical protein